MTKSQTIYYIAIVVIITFLAYLYTTVVNAPEANPVVTETPNEQAVEVESEAEVPAEAMPEVDPGVISNNEPAKPVLLPNTSWRWDYTEATDESLLTLPKKPEAFVLAFDDAGRASSQTDCNSLGGTYTLSGDKLNFGAMMSTKMFCEDSDEVVYGEQLSLVESVDLTLPTSMRLMLKGGAGTMVFTQIIE